MLSTIDIHVAPNPCNFVSTVCLHICKTLVNYMCNNRNPANSKNTKFAKLSPVVFTIPRDSPKIGRNFQSITWFAAN